MGYGYGGWGYAPYKSVAARKQEAEKTVAKMVKDGKKISPITIVGKKIATTFWGKGWCDHLESFSDYANRLPRGRSYVRNAAVLDLNICKGKVDALVQGSSNYQVNISVNPVPESKWKAILQKCSGEIGSVIELLQGKFSSSVMTTMTDKKNGLFPLPEEIKLKCSCPDWAVMCKHVAAVLYGVGARLDREPQLLFTLRNADHTELLTHATIKSTNPPKDHALEGQDLSALFGIDVADGSDKNPPVKVLPKSPAKPRNPISGKEKAKRKELRKKREERLEKVAAASKKPVIAKAKSKKPAIKKPARHKKA